MTELRQDIHAASQVYSSLFEDINQMVASDLFQEGKSFFFSPCSCRPTTSMIVSRFQLCTPRTFSSKLHKYHTFEKSFLIQENLNWQFFALRSWSAAGIKKPDWSVFGVFESDRSAFEVPLSDWSMLTRNPPIGFEEGFCLLFFEKIAVLISPDEISCLVTPKSAPLCGSLTGKTFRNPIPSAF